MSAITGIPINDWTLLAGPISVAIAIGAYCAVRFRRGSRGFTTVDALLVGASVAILGVMAIPLVEQGDQKAKAGELQRNLRTLRLEIERYKSEHDNALPVAFEAAMPQLTRATNREGIPGPAGQEHPLGPYLRGGLPTNPFTGRSVITLTEEFPPTTPSGNGGWLYHQQTGQITADHAAFLAE